MAYAEENGLLFMETSAKTAVNVNEIFVAIGMSCARLETVAVASRKSLLCCKVKRPFVQTSIFSQMTQRMCCVVFVFITAKRLPKTDNRPAANNTVVPSDKEAKPSGGGCC
jgi:hypothetical protein